MEINVRREGSYFEGICHADGYSIENTKHYLPLEWSLGFQRKVLEEFPNFLFQIGEEGHWEGMPTDGAFLHTQSGWGCFICNAGNPPGYLFNEYPASMPDEDYKIAFDMGGICSYLKPRVEPEAALQFLIDADRVLAAKDNFRKDVAAEWLPQALRVYTYVLSWVDSAEYPVLFTLEEGENREFYEQMIRVVGEPVWGVRGD